MKIVIWIVFFAAIAGWFLFGMYLVGLIDLSILSTIGAELDLPKTTAELGDSFGVFSALLSSLALILAIAAMIIQSKQQTDSNVLGAYSARQQFLLSECDRLESEINKLKQSSKYDSQLFKNMVNKKKRLLEEANNIDNVIRKLLEKF